MISMTGKSKIVSPTTGSDFNDRPAYVWCSPKGQRYIDALEYERRGINFFEEICTASETVHQHRANPPIRQLMTDALDLQSLELIQQAVTRNERRSAVKVAIISQINSCCRSLGLATINKLPLLQEWVTLLANDDIVFEPGSSGVTLQDFKREFNASKKPGTQILSSLYQALKAGCIFFQTEHRRVSLAL